MRTKCEQVRAKQQPAHLAKPKSLRDVENTPFRTFNRIAGPRGHLPSNFYLSEYTGSFGSHPRMAQHWGTWGSLKTAGPYLAANSPAYNPHLSLATSRSGFQPDPLMTTRLRPTMCR